MPKSFSIAKARHDLAALVQQLEHQSRIELTRRGKPVAVLLSLGDYTHRHVGKSTKDHSRSLSYLSNFCGSTSPIHSVFMPHLLMCVSSIYVRA